MAKPFLWRAYQHNTPSSGVHYAVSKKFLRHQLRKQGWRRIKLIALPKATKVQLKSSWLIWFYRQLYTMLSTGLPLFTALEQMAELNFKPNWQAMLFYLQQKLTSGATLSQACSALPGCFASLDQQLISGGEQSGQLEPILSHLIDYHTERVRLKRQLLQAITYPATVLGFSVTTVVIMLTWVVPKFQQFFAASGQSLPTITAGLIATSKLIQRQGCWWLSYALFTTVLLSWLIARYDKCQQLWQKFLLSLPIIGNLLIAKGSARSCYLLGMLLQAGIDIGTATGLTIKLQPKGLYRTSWQEINKQLNHGQSLATALPNNSRHFPTLLRQLIATGEATGQLATMLLKLAEYYNDQFSYKTQQLTRWLEPICLVLTGSVVAIIVLAIYLPMFELGQTI